MTTLHWIGLCGSGLLFLGLLVVVTLRNYLEHGGRQNGYRRFAPGSYYSEDRSLFNPKDCLEGLQAFGVVVILGWVILGAGRIFFAWALELGDCWEFFFFWYLLLPSPFLLRLIVVGVQKSLEAERRAKEEENNRKEGAIKRAEKEAQEALTIANGAKELAEELRQAISYRESHSDSSEEAWAFDIFLVLSGGTPFDLVRDSLQTMLVLVLDETSFTIGYRNDWTVPIDPREEYACFKACQKQLQSCLNELEEEWTRGGDIISEKLRATDDSRCYAHLSSNAELAPKIEEDLVKVRKWKRRPLERLMSELKRWLAELKRSRPDRLREAKRAEEKDPQPIKTIARPVNDGRHQVGMLYEEFPCDWQ